MKLLNNKKTAEEVAKGNDLRGKTVLITGCNSGLGLQTMGVLAGVGAKVIGFARTLKKAQMACDSVRGNVQPVACELTEVSSIKSAVSSVDESLDVIIANAGVMALPRFTMTLGIEKHMFINHIAHALIIKGLLKHLKPSGSIVLVSSGAHAYARGSYINFATAQDGEIYKPWVAYGQSKLANILYTKALSKRLKNDITVNCLHPGVIESGLWRHIASDDLHRMKRNMSFKSVKHGAAMSVFLSVDPRAKNYSGEYFSNGSVAKPSALALNDKLREDLWCWTEQVLRDLEQ